MSSISHQRPSSVKTPGGLTPKADFIGPESFIYPERPYKSIFWSVCSFILIVELAERCAYYGLNQGLVNFIKEPQHLDMGASLASALKSLFSQVYYATGLLGGYLADARIGRYKTVLVASVLYVVGMFMEAWGAHPDVLSPTIFFIGMFAFVCFGGGMFKANLSVLGGDQFDLKDPKQAEDQTRFFQYFYWCINIGAGVAYGLLSQISASGMGAISKEMGYFWVFTICAIILLIAILIFIAASGRYIKKPPSGTALSNFIGVVGESGKRNSFPSGHHGFILGVILLLGGFAVNVTSILLRMFEVYGAQDALSYSAGILDFGGMIFIIIFCGVPTYVYKARMSDGGSYMDMVVQDAYWIIRTLPVASVIIGFWCIQDQPDTNLQLQTQQFDLRMGDGQIPGPMVSLFNTLAIIIMVPVVERVVFPLFKKSMGYEMSILQRIGTGIVLGICSMAYAAGIEYVRRARPVLTCPPDDNSACCNAVGECGEYMLSEAGGQPMSDISWIFNIPGYFFIGTAEVFISPASYEMFYTQVGASLRSMCFAINLLCYSFGSGTAAIIANILGEYLTEDLNDGHVEYLYFAAGGLGCVLLPIFVFFVCPRFEYRNDDDQAVSITKISHAGRQSAASAVFMGADMK